jgi:hypothetical protein
MATSSTLRTAVQKSYNSHPANWWSAALVSVVLGGYAVAAQCAPSPGCRAQCRPGQQQCGARCNPCNPCAARNPCAAANPCAATRCDPCAANPCAANPCAAGQPNPCAAKRVTRPDNYRPYEGNPCALKNRGEVLFNDTSLSSNGLSCATCHRDGAGYMATFAQPYPHSVAMAMNMFGMNSIHLDEMVQVCMLEPMAAEPLAWDSEDLAALTAYMASVQQELAANPCALQRSNATCNPCAASNPCAAANPCALR